ncbi:Putative O-methyltransferase MSMEG_5073 [Kingella potus]|uniref:O-methyltransferase MSMEG_5073 n=1 Tax=Kingella potus TaxID=265175 RepID=A0A377R0F8_9NEIS|nr:class I SAM-dependent methyltransferase [Kingella potus]STR00732.1 Putative O-methyltransferase MSMEG_5073 [Kingella potus]
MSTRPAADIHGLSAYLRQTGTAEHPVLARIRANNATHRMGKMAVAPEQAALLAWLVRLTHAERCLEIGVFTGYSSTALALALPEHGRITACDLNATYTSAAQQAWRDAGVAHKITLHLQPALITLDSLIAEGRAQSYDLAFIDADKPPTPQYYERCLQLVRPGGIIAIDNVLLHGRVLRPPEAADPPAVAVMRTFNAALAHDSRVIPLTLPLGDGLTLLIRQ